MKKPPSKVKFEQLLEAVSQGNATPEQIEELRQGTDALLQQRNELNRKNRLFREHLERVVGTIELHIAKLDWIYDPASPEKNKGGAVAKTVSNLEHEKDAASRFALDRDFDEVRARKERCNAHVRRRS